MLAQVAAKNVKKAEELLTLPEDSDSRLGTKSFEVKEVVGR